MFTTLKFNGGDIGTVFTTLGISSVFMPALLGIIADKYINGERVLGISHLISAVLLVWAAQVTDPGTMFWAMLLVSMFYMPTIALTNAVSYNLLKENKMDIITTFPKIRVWGTIGFIVAMWVVDLLGWTQTSSQLIVAAISGVVISIFAFLLPACPPRNTSQSSSWVSALGLDAFVLFKKPNLLIFFIFSMLLGAALQITNIVGQDFLFSFSAIDQYKDSFTVKHPGILMSVSQISETVFILTIPYMLKRFGIKMVILISMLAWVLRFGFFAIGNPGNGFILLVLSMIIYGMAFDFFNISGSLFIEKETDSSIRASAQGLFMMMVNGFGSILGAKACGLVVDHFTIDGVRNWPHIWYTFAAYALVLTVIFPFIFKSNDKVDEDVHIAH
jgi:MFS transporter, NHS family, xanthosine permease